MRHLARTGAELIWRHACLHWPLQGGSTPDPRVQEAMDAANASFVPMDELQKVSRALFLGTAATRSLHYAARDQCTAS